MVPSMGRKKIVFLPLDERPCNYNYPKFLFGDNVELVICEREILGEYKNPGDNKAISDFLIAETVDAYGLVVSIDELIYGGIVRSRLHHLEYTELQKRLNLLKALKENNPNLIIYAFNLVMRCPNYNMDVEEPTYFNDYGTSLFTLGRLRSKESQNILSDDERKTLRNINIPKEILDDYLLRREKNNQINLECLNLVKENIIDFMIYPQDDASEYSFASMDQDRIRNEIKEKCLHTKVYVYPGADEVGLTLCARMINKMYNFTPKVYLKYPSIETPFVIPCLEDRPLDISIKYQINASGGVVTTDLNDCDMVLVAFMGAKKMIPNPARSHDKQVDVLANYIECIEFIKYYLDIVPIAIADMTFLNGGDLELLEMLKEEKIIEKIKGYAGWNTASNTLGTVIPMCYQYLLFGEKEYFQKFLFLRYLEDIGYCTKVRKLVTDRDLDKYKLNYFNLKDKTTIINEIVYKELEEFKNKYLSEFKNYEITKCFLPWKRMFEVELEVKKCVK